MKEIGLESFKANTRQFKSHMRGRLSVDASRGGLRGSGEKNASYIPPKYAALMNRGQDSNVQDRSNLDGFLTGRAVNTSESQKKQLADEE